MNGLTVLPSSPEITNVTLFGKIRLSEYRVEAFSFVMHYKSILKPLSMRWQTLANAFNETAAGRLESFTEPLLLATMKSLQ